MRNVSALRGRKLRERHLSGAPQWEYFAEIFDRWMRIFGPPVAARPASRYVSATRNPGMVLINQMSEQRGVADAIERILGCIDHHATIAKFEAHVFGGLHDGADSFVVYVNGRRYFLLGERKIKRFGELFMLYALLGPSSLLSEMMEGVGNMMEGVPE